MDILMKLSGLKAVVLFIWGVWTSFFPFFFFCSDPFLLDNLKLVRLISSVIQKPHFGWNKVWGKIILFFISKWFKSSFQLVIWSRYLTVTYSTNFYLLLKELSSLNLLALSHANCSLHYINGFVKKTITPSLESCVFLFAQTWCTCLERVIAGKAV